MNEKVMISTKISPEVYQLMRKLCFETGLRQYQVIEEGIKLLVKKQETGELKIIKENREAD